VKRYRFRLEALLRVRRIEEDRAALELAAARNAAIRAAHEQDAAETHYETRRQGLDRQTLATFLARRNLADTSAAMVIAARQRSTAAAATVEDRRTDWSTAAGRVTGLERVDERGRDAHRAEADRQEGLTIDDIVTSRHRRVVRFDERDES